MASVTCKPMPGATDSRCRLRCVAKTARTDCFRVHGYRDDLQSAYFKIYDGRRASIFVLIII